MSEQYKAPSAEATQTLAALRRAVKNTLQRKQLLGQFAVVWRDGQAALLDDQVQDKAAFIEALQQVPANDQAGNGRAGDSQTASGVGEPKGAYRPKSPRRTDDE